MVGLALPFPVSGAPEKFSDAQLEHFEKVIRPLLVKRCHGCHSAKAKSLKAELRLDSRAGALRGGETGPALKPGDPDASVLIQAIRYAGDYKMPPKGKLPPEEIRLLTEWVRAGAAWTTGGQPGQAAPAERFDLAARRASHWAWQPVRKTPPGLLRATAEDWPRGSLDRYVAASLERAGLQPADDADPATWLRRVTYDLVGLPPTPEALEAFLAETGSAARARVVDRLLGSRQFGEHWARHWLDLVRFAESRGHESDYVTPNAWQYRDYVIRALNQDVSYDQFVIEHLAGDLLEEPRLHPQQKFNESILGTGFWFLGEWCHSPVDLRQDEGDRQDNMLDVFGKTFLGLTVGCARCHDHKFDAISHRDYYALSGFLQSSGFRLVRFDTLEHNRQVAGELSALRKRATSDLTRVVLSTIRPGLKDLSTYLLAAKEVLQAGPDRPVPGRLNRSSIAVARTRKLDVDRLRRLVQELVVAEKDRDNPLHAWSRLARAVKQDTPQAVGAALIPLKREWTRRQQAAGQALAGARMLVDFSKLQGAGWRQDGSAFRSGPLQPGDALLSKDAAHPITRLVLSGGAAWDPAFAGLTLSGGAENENGKLSGWVRSGRTFKTSTFELKTGRLFYLVSGAGHAFASVDSHRLLHGPLHGETVLTWDAGNQQPRWIAQNLSRQRGHDVHIEFSPRGDAPLTLLMVVEAAKAPGDPYADLLIRGLAERIDPNRVKSLEDFARQTTAVLVGASRRAGTRTLASSPSDAALVDWMIRHAAIFQTDPAAAETTIATAARPVLAARDRLVMEIRKPSRLAMAMWDGSATDESLFIRGDHRHPGDRVPRRLLEALGGAGPRKTESGSGRLGLARQLVDPSNPLLARVIVNRLWHHLFGRGLVPTVDNFGVQGERPSHPELLDALAIRFVEEGWSIKSMIRHLVLSRTYGQSSRPQGRWATVDPDNRLLHSRRVRRLQGEAIRDAMLMISGRLDLKPPAKSIPIYLSAHMIGRGRPKSGPMDGNGHRTIYIGVRRNFLSPLMLAYDTPQPFSTVGRRTQSNVPGQALILMNDPFVISQSKLWARRLLSRKKLDAEEKITSLYRSAFSRRPSNAEQSAARRFLVEQGRRYGLAGEKGLVDERAWSDLCHVMFNVKEFVFVN